MDTKTVRTTSDWLSSKQIDQSVEQYKKMNPKGFQRAQEFGDFLLSSRLANPDNMIEKVDLEGDDILVKKLRQDIEFNGLTKEDLTEHEIELLKRKYGGETWDCEFFKHDKNE